MLLNNQFWVALCSSKPWSTIFDYLLTTQLFWSVSLDPRLDEIFKHCWGPPLRISSRRRSFAFGGANLKIHTLWALVRTKLDPFFQHESTQPHSPFVLYQGVSPLSSSLYDYSPCKREIHGCPILKLSQQIGAPLPPPCLAPSACVDDLHFPFHVPPSFGPGGLKFGENCSEAGSFRDPSFGTSRLTKENMTKIHQWEKVIQRKVSPTNGLVPFQATNLLIP